MAVSTTNVLAYHKYLGPGSQSVYSTQYFCGECRQQIDHCYTFPTHPEDLERENEALPPFLRSDDRELAYFSFCPWCGVRFEDEWWKEQVIQNERAIDHYQNPGTHKGDTHEFRGTDQNCMAGHWLGVSGGDKVCWCDPEIEPGLMGCVIRHQDKRYEDVQAAEQAKRDAALVARRADCKPMDLPDDHDPETCGYCEGSAYDQETCDTCEGRGCEDCAGHGFVGYSW